MKRGSTSRYIVATHSGIQKMVLPAIQSTLVLRVNLLARVLTVGLRGNAKTVLPIQYTAHVFTYLLSELFQFEKQKKKNVHVKGQIYHNTVTSSLARKFCSKLSRDDHSETGSSQEESTPTATKSRIGM